MLMDGQQVMLDVGGDWAGLDVRVEGVAFGEAMVKQGTSPICNHDHETEGG